MNSNASRSILWIGNFFVSRLGGSTPSLIVVDNLRLHGWNVYTVPKSKNRIMRLFEMVFFIIRKRKRHQIAVIEVYSGLAFIWAEIAAALLGTLKKRVILNLHGGNLPVFAKENRGRVQRLFSRVDMIIAPSNYLQEGLKSFGKDILIIPNPIDITQYELLCKSNIHPELIWLRAFHKIYNPEMIPQVIFLLGKKFQAVSCIMVGPDKQDGSLDRVQHIARELDVSGRIKIVGKVNKSEVPHWLRKGDIFLNTSNVDNTPVSIIEAMAMGLPIVSTDVGGIPYILNHEENALLVPQDDPEAMARGISRILTDPDMANTLSQNARKTAEKYDREAIIPQWEQLFQEVLDYD